MKEATGEVSMTMVTIVAIGVIGAILAAFWQPITNWIGGLFQDPMGNANPNQQIQVPNINP